MKPNVLLILADDIAPNALGCYGQELPTTAIDALAQRGLRFSNAWCASAVCTPSRFNFLTGRYGSRCSHPEFLRGIPAEGGTSVEFNVWLEGTTPTLASLLRNTGYRTAFAGKWHNSPHADALACESLDLKAEPSAPGMDAALARRQKILCEEVARVGGYDQVGGVLWENPTEEPLERLRAHHLEWSLGHALDFLETAESTQPFFLHYASTCYHGPNLATTVEEHEMLETPAGRISQPPRGAIPRQEWKQRCAEAGLPFDHESLSFLWLDHEVRLLMETLRRKGLLENTIVVFAGDHGNEPGKGTCYDTGGRIPIVLAGPGVPGGSVFPHFAQNVDILPTLLSLLQLQPPSDCDGRDLSTVWQGNSSPRVAVYLENGFSRAVRTERWKLIVKSRPPLRRQMVLPDGLQVPRDHYGEQWTFPALRIAASTHPGYFASEELYDLENDPEERVNLARQTEFKPILADMRVRFYSIQQKLPAPLQAPDGYEPEAQSVERVLQRFGADTVEWWPNAEARYHRYFRGRKFV